MLGYKAVVSPSVGSLHLARGHYEPGSLRISHCLLMMGAGLNFLYHVSVKKSAHITRRWAGNYTVWMRGFVIHSQLKCHFQNTRTLFWMFTLISSRVRRYWMMWTGSRRRSTTRSCSGLWTRMVRFKWHWAPARKQFTGNMLLERHAAVWCMQYRHSISKTLLCCMWAISLRKCHFSWPGKLGTI